VEYTRVDEFSVIVNGKIFKKRHQYSDFLYFFCANARTNERNKLKYAENCKSKIKRKIPIIDKGIAFLVKDHIENCGQEQPIQNTIENQHFNSQKNDILIEKLTEMIKENPTIKPNQATTLLNQDENFQNLINIDLKNLMKKIRKDLEFNSPFYAFNNK